MRGFLLSGREAQEKGSITPSAHDETQLGGDFDKFSDEFTVNCILVDAIASHALNCAR